MLLMQHSIQTVQLEGAHLDQMLPLDLHPVSHCWGLSPWKPSCNHGWCKWLVFVRKLVPRWLVFCCCFSSLLASEKVSLWLIYMSRPHIDICFFTTEWNKPLKQLNLEKPPHCRPHIWWALLLACHSFFIDIVHSQLYCTRHFGELP